MATLDTIIATTDRTPNLVDIIREVRQGCPAHEKDLCEARELSDWYEGASEKFIPFRPSEDSLSWLTRPKRVSFLTRQAVDKLCSHLYKPGPQARTVAGEPEVSAWYGRVVQDLALNAVLQQADRLATLHGLCAIGVYPTGDPARPIGYHLYPRQDFVFWTAPDDPRVATAVCTITRCGPDSVRYRLWTASHYYTFFRSRDYGYTPGGWNVSRFDPATSGEHGYGALPFTFISHELPTTTLRTKGLGPLLAKINKALNIDKSNLALWVHLYAKPLGFVLGVPPEWRPKIVDGCFVPLPATVASTHEPPVLPKAEYLESNLDIAAVHAYIVGEANQALAELGVPLTVAMQSDGGSGVMARSGLGIAALDAQLIAYTKGRRPLFERHEQHLAALICRVGASAGGPLAPALARAAAAASLRVSWSEPRIDLPGPGQDAADQWELEHDLTDAIQVLMRRHGLTEEEAVEQYRNIQRRKQIAAQLQADPEAEVVVEQPEPAVVPAEGDGRERPTGDMGVPSGGPSDKAAPAEQLTPSITLTTVIAPSTPIPAADVLVPGAPLGGTEL